MQDLKDLKRCFHGCDRGGNPLACACGRRGPPRYGPGRGPPRHVPFGSRQSRTTVSCFSLANRDNLVNPAPAWLSEGQALALRGREVALPTVARGPVPRDSCSCPRSVVREHPLPNGSREGTPAQENKPTVVVCESGSIETRRALLPGRNQDQEVSPTERIEEI